MDPAERTALAVGYGIIAFALLTVGIGVALWPLDDEPARRLAVTVTFDPTTQYQGICTVVTPPDPDPCDAVAGQLLAARGALVNASYHKLWVRANPGEVGRLSDIMAAPVCSTASTPQPSTMLTWYGTFLADVMRAVACARHPEPLTWPAANPTLDPNRADKSPPTPPGPLQVQPSG